MRFTGLEVKIVDQELKRIGRSSQAVDEDKAAKLVEDLVIYLHEHFEQELEFVRVTYDEQPKGTGLPASGVITGDLITRLAEVTTQYFLMNPTGEEQQ